MLRLLLPTLGVLVLFLSGCEERPSLPEDHDAFKGIIHPTRQRLTARPEQAFRPIVAPRDGHFDALLLSGGGQLGAFGAGLLNSWGGKGIPEFELITGISTGAIQASHAFIAGEPGFALGSPQDPLKTMHDYYRDITNDQVQYSRGDLLLAFLLFSSLNHMGPLAETLEGVLSDGVLEAVARKHDENRGRLYAVATNADSAELTIFDLGTLASRFASHLRAHRREPWNEGDYHPALNLPRGMSHREYARFLKQCYITCILASSAFPGYLNPIYIEGQMYFDGGVQQAVYFDDRLAPLVAGIELPRERRHLWALMNVALYPDAQMRDPLKKRDAAKKIKRVPFQTRPNLIDVIARSSMIMNKRMNLYMLSLMEEQLGDRYAIHYSWIDEREYDRLDNPFQPELDPRRQQQLIAFAERRMVAWRWRGRGPTAEPVVASDEPAPPSPWQQRPDFLFDLDDDQSQRGTLAEPVLKPGEPLSRR